MKLRRIKSSLAMVLVLNLVVGGFSQYVAAESVPNNYQAALDVSEQTDHNMFFTTEKRASRSLNPDEDLILSITDTGTMVVSNIPSDDTFAWLNTSIHEYPYGSGAPRHSIEHVERNNNASVEMQLPQDNGVYVVFLNARAERGGPVFEQFRLTIAVRDGKHYFANHSLSPGSPFARSLERVVLDHLLEHGGRSYVGVSVGIVMNDEVLFFNFGETERGGNAVTEHTIFEIGSITKTVTGIVLADLVNQGLVSLDDKLEKYVGHPVSLNGVDVTLLDLATHTSGLGRLGFNQSVLGVLAGAQLNTIPGEAYQYSNLGFALLGRVIHEATGKTYEDAARELIFDRLGMANTMTTLTELTEEQKRLLTTPHAANGEITTPWIPSDVYRIATGHLQSSAYDMTQYIRHNLGQGDIDFRLKSAMLKAQTLQREPIDANGRPRPIGLGWNRELSLIGPNSRIFEHGGLTRGSHSFIRFNHQVNAGVVVLTNIRPQAQVTVQAERLANQLLNAIRDNSIRLISEPQSVALAPDDVTIFCHVGATADIDVTVQGLPPAQIFCIAYPYCRTQSDCLARPSYGQSASITIIDLPPGIEASGYIATDLTGFGSSKLRLTNVGGTEINEETHDFFIEVRDSGGRTTSRSNVATLTVTDSVADIAIQTQPTTLSYTAGQTLDLAGLVVTLTFEDTTTLNVPFADFDAKGLMANPEHGTVMEIDMHHDHPIVISHESGLSTYTNNLTVTSAPNPVTGIAIQTQPTTLSYTTGQTLDLAGLVVTLTFEDTTTLNVPFSEFDANDLTATPPHGTVMEVDTHDNLPVVISHADGLSADTNNLTVTNIPASTYTVTRVADSTVPTGNMAITPDGPQEAGTAMTLTITPPTGQQIVDNSIIVTGVPDITVNTTGATFPMPEGGGEITVNAVFENIPAQTYIVTRAADSTVPASNMAITPDGPQEAGTAMTVTITPPTGQQIVDDSIIVTGVPDITVNATGATFPMPEGGGEITVDAVFENITTQTAPNFTAHPANQSASVDQDVTFHVAVSGNPTPTLQWQVSIDNGSTWADIPGEVDSTLAINNVTMSMDGNQYRTVATNDAGSAVSNAATLVVTATNEAPMIMGPAEMTLSTGYSATNSTTFTITGAPAPIVTRTVYPASAESEIAWNDSQSWLDIAAGLEEGTYIVTLRAANGIGIPATHTFTLTVTDDDEAPTIDGPTVMALAVGYSATNSVPFTITGDPTPTVTRTVYPASAETEITWNDSQRWLDIATGLEEGTYIVTLRADNGAGTPATHTFTLTVTEQPPVIVVMEAAVMGVTLTGAPSGTIITTNAPWVVTLPAGSNVSNLTNEMITVAAAPSEAEAMVQVTGTGATRTINIPAGGTVPDNWLAMPDAVNVTVEVASEPPTPSPEPPTSTPTPPATTPTPPVTTPTPTPPVATPTPTSPVTTPTPTSPVATPTPTSPVATPTPTSPVATPTPTSPVATPTPTSPVATPTPTSPVATPTPTSPVATPTPTSPVTTPTPTSPVATPTPTSPVATPTPTSPVTTPTLTPTLQVTPTVTPTPTPPSENEVTVADALYRLGLFVGTGSDADGIPIFELNRPPTRLEALALVIRLMGLQSEAMSFTGNNRFTDIPTWGEQYAAFGYSIGITFGVNEERTLFAPNRQVTAHEFTAFLLRVLGYSEADGDFIFEEAMQKASVVGFFSPFGIARISTDNFLRDHAVHAMANTLLTQPKDNSEYLLYQLADQGVFSREDADWFRGAIRIAE